MDNRRRSSTGRSKILESSIAILSEFINSKSIEDIYGYVINNTLPNELRSTVWRILLNILNKDDCKNWAKTTNGLRDSYYKLTNQINEDELKLLRNEINEEQAKLLVEEKTFNLISLARKDLTNMSYNLDFLKSGFISELILKLVYLWSKVNSNYTDYNQILFIAAWIVYSLYPSILHIEISSLGFDEKDNLDVQSIFYYLNTEEHFDADVYTIFSTLMARGVTKFLQDKITYKPLTINEINDLIINDDHQSLLKRAKKLNKIDRILGFYLRCLDKDLLNKLSAQKNTIYSILEGFVSTLLAKNLKSENIIYLWENIFINETSVIDKKLFHFDNDFLCFLDFILLSFIFLNKEHAGKSDFGVLLINSLQTLNPKDVLKKAIKLKEKFYEIYD